jgi:ATP-dependent Clp protease ATP-binding subunit ClpC
MRGRMAGMYEKFTDRSRRVMALAKDEARRLCHHHLGTEHLLLGLIVESGGVAANILKHLDFDLAKARDQVERLVQRDSPADAKSKLSETPRFKHLVEHSLEEARHLNHHYIGTEHLLLGLLRDEKATGAVALTNSGLRSDEVRNEVLCLLGHGNFY